MAATSIARIFVIAIGLGLLPAAAAAQATTPAIQMPSESAEIRTQELVLKDGSRLFGTVEREDEREIVFKTLSGSQMTVQRAEVVSLRAVKGRIERGEFRTADSHRSRLFFAPTGRQLEKGQVSVGVFEFLAPFVQVGVTDRFSIGGGTPLVFGFDEEYRPFWITPKFQVYNSEKAQVAVGALQLINFDGDAAGIGYGVSTFGNSDNAVTVGAGFTYGGDSTLPVVMVGGETRVRRNLKLITENYMWKDGDGILSGGVRFLGERLSADLALAMPIGVGEFFMFPVVNFVYVF